MMIKEAQAILANDNSSHYELESARIAFRNAGFKNLAESCRLLIMNMTTEKANVLQNEIKEDLKRGKFDEAFSKAGDALLARCEAVIAATPLEIRDRFEEKKETSL